MEFRKKILDNLMSRFWGMQFVNFRGSHADIFWRSPKQFVNFRGSRAVW